MSKNLNRLTAAANRIAAHHDYAYVWAQVKKYKPPVAYPDQDSARAIDKATRALIDWAGVNGIKIDLPEGWSDE